MQASPCTNALVVTRVLLQVAAWWLNLSHHTTAWHRQRAIQSDSPVQCICPSSQLLTVKPSAALGGITFEQISIFIFDSMLCLYAPFCFVLSPENREQVFSSCFSHGSQVLGKSLYLYKKESRDTLTYHTCLNLPYKFKEILQNECVWAQLHL